jgi:hypothetical protein
MFKKMIEKGPLMGELMRNIRNTLGKNGDEPINLEDFKEYFNRFK